MIKTLFFNGDKERYEIPYSNPYSFIFSSRFL